MVLHKLRREIGGCMETGKALKTYTRTGAELEPPQTDTMCMLRLMRPLCQATRDAAASRV